MSENLQNKFKVALIQMQSQPGIRQNFESANVFLSNAIEEHRAKLVVFPENFLGLGIESYTARFDDFQHYIKKFQEIAREKHVSLVLGSIPFPAGERSKKCFSRSLLIDEFGELACFYDKIHLFDAMVDDSQGRYKESDSFDAGHDIKVANVDKHILGLSICYDLRFPELYQGLRSQGAEMISVPSAFTYNTGEAHWEILLRARAIETQCFVLAANQCGDHVSEETAAVRSTWGHSMIIDPWGRVLTSLKHSPGVCSAELDFQELFKARNAMDIVGHKKLSVSH